MGGWVYIMTSRAFGTLYIGVTNDIARRAWEHRQDKGSAFTSQYRPTRLVFMERHEDIAIAIQREKSLRRWPRAWKLDLIEAVNPGWDDLFDRLNA
jgi:putative endonuclease